MKWPCGGCARLQAQRRPAMAPREVGTSSEPRVDAKPLTPTARAFHAIPSNLGRAFAIARLGRETSPPTARALGELARLLYWYRFLAG